MWHDHMHGHTKEGAVMVVGLQRRIKYHGDARSLRQRMVQLCRFVKEPFELRTARKLMTYEATKTTGGALRCVTTNI